MSKYRFYQPGLNQSDGLITLNEKNSHHIQKVLRLKINTEIELFDGLNFTVMAKIHAFEKKKVIASMVMFSEVNNESCLELHLYQALSKGDRFDWVVQKAVELGVTSFTPTITQRNVVKLDDKRRQKKIQHWQGIIESASEQCGRNKLMQLKPITVLSEVIQTSHEGLRLILTPHTKSLIAEETAAQKSIELLIGPEGGFEPSEVEAVLNLGGEPMNLGPRILRTETAAVAACAIIQSTYGDMTI